ncbi:MAG: hypothetical protein U0T81_10475 [Saprospiraceae bacterium]
MLRLAQATPATEKTGGPKWFANRTVDYGEIKKEHDPLRKAVFEQERELVLKTREFYVVTSSYMALKPVCQVWCYRDSL